MKAPFQEYDIVRVVRLNSGTRKFDGTESVKRAPQVGDEATICHQYDPKDLEAPVVVEMVDRSGMTIWLADFLPDELELLHRQAK